MHNDLHKDMVCYDEWTAPKARKQLSILGKYLYIFGLILASFYVIKCLSSIVMFLWIKTVVIWFINGV